MLRSIALLRVLDYRFVQRRLLLGQIAEDLHLDLVRQIGDDALVGLQSAKDERRRDASQALQTLSCIGVHLNGHEEALAKRAFRSEESRVEKLHEAPQIGDVVLDRRAGESDPVIRPRWTGRRGPAWFAAFLMFCASSRISPAQSHSCERLRSRCSNA